MTSKFEALLRQLLHLKASYFFLPALLTVFLFSTQPSKAYAIPINVAVTCDPSLSLFGQPFVAERVILTGTVSFYTIDGAGSHVQLNSPTEITPVGHEMSSIMNFLLFAPQGSPIYFNFDLMLSDPLGVYGANGLYTYIDERNSMVSDISLAELAPGQRIDLGLYGGQWDIAGYINVAAPAPVPEPSLLLLLGVGLAGLAALKGYRIAGPY